MNKKTTNSQVKSDGATDTNKNEHTEGVTEFITANIEQIRKIQVLEKEIEFWRNKVSIKRLIVNKILIDCSNHLVR